MTETFVIVGGGLAAGQAVTELRETGFDGRVVLFTAESHLPYERPPLSKDYLLGQAEIDTVFVHPREWYDEHDIEVHRGVAARMLDLAEHRVVTAEGVETYDRLLLATGARPRSLPVDTGDAPVATLRTIEDAKRLRAAFGEGRRIVLIGGGWIGLEVAAAARRAGSEVTVLEALEQPLVGVLGPEVAEVFAALHRRHGVDVRTGAAVTDVEPGADATTVHVDGGAPVAADLVVVGIGAVPDVELAEAAGLATDDGVLVDAHLATSDPDVFAAGDVANAEHPLLGGRIRVEHWDTAQQQGALAARNLAGAGEQYDRLPFFFTDQYDLGMEYVGSIAPAGYDEVALRGDTDGLDFQAWWLKDGRVAAGMHVNQWDATDEIRRLVGQRVDAAHLRDPGVPLTDLGTDGA